MWIFMWTEDAFWVLVSQLCGKPGLYGDIVAGRALAIPGDFIEAARVDGAEASGYFGQSCCRS